MVKQLGDELPFGSDCVMLRVKANKVARLVRGWSTFSPEGGVNGIWNQTLRTTIESDQQHDRLCDERGLTRITSKQLSQDSCNAVIDAQRERNREDAARTARLSTISTLQREMTANGAHPDVAAAQASDLVYSADPMHRERVRSQASETLRAAEAAGTLAAVKAVEESAKSSNGGTS